MTRRIPGTLRSLILPFHSLLSAMAVPCASAAQVAQPGQVEPAYCAFRTIYDAVRGGTMPLVMGCDAARVASAFREARMPIEVVPPDDAPRFFVTPSGGQSVPSLPVMGQSPTEGQALPKPPLEVEGAHVQNQKFKAPLISLATAAPRRPIPTPTVASPDPSPSSPPPELAVRSDVSATKAGDTIAFTVAAQEPLLRPVSLTYVISDPASCAPPARRGTPLLLR